MKLVLQVEEVKSETQGPMANEDLKAPEVAEVLGRELAG
jgi:hypothetical protein